MSDHYRALTRTYRPTTFDDIVSQRHVSDTLKNAIKQQRLAHAYMFCGPRGVGKTTMARVLARTVNDIDNSVDGEGLNQTLNIVEIDAASNNSVDDIRDLRERVRIPPQNGRYKIYIIDEVHMLSKSAFNALLKTLEEPPDHVIFIFATTEPHKVLPTILSRVQRFDFKRISVDQIVDRLQVVAKDQDINIDPESLHVIAKKADGALRDALGLLDQAIAFCGTDIEHEELLRALNVVSTDRMFQFMEAVQDNDTSAGLELIDELLQEGYDIQEFLVGLLEHLRNLYVALNSQKMHLVEASEDTKKRYRDAATSFSQEDLMRMMHLVSEAQYKIKEANQPRIQFEITLLKLIHMERTKNLNTLLNELESLKKKLSKLDKANVKDETADGATESYDGQPVGGGRGTKTEDNGVPEPDNVQEDIDAKSEAESKMSEPEAQTASAPEESPPVKEELDPQTEPEDEPQQTEPEEADPRPQPQVSNMEEATAPADQQPEVDTAAAEEDEEEENDFFGAPSLNTFENQSTGSGNNGAVSQVEEPKPSVPNRTQISLPEIKDEWNRYLEELTNEVPQLLHMQMQRIEPVNLKNRELTLRCSNDFAKRLVEENKRDLSKVLESVVGIFLQMDAVVEQTEEETEDSKSPYERFKELQERDPKIKMLVELFGAELDYNLSR